MKIEEIIKKTHEKLCDSGQNQNLDKAINWLFDVKNKHIIFSEFETILTYGVSNIEEFKEKVDSNFDFDRLYFKIPISSKLSSGEMKLLEEVVKTDLVQTYEKDISKFIKVFNNIHVLSNQLETASKDLERFVTPKKNKFK